MWVEVGDGAPNASNSVLVKSEKYPVGPVRYFVGGGVGIGL